MDVSIGIAAYNEEKHIGKLLKELLNQKTKIINITEIIVVSSGSTDKTNNLVRSFSKKYKKIKLITQKEREGKYSAINEFLKAAKSDMLVLESADTLPERETIEKLCLPFSDPKVGVTTGNPTPKNNNKNFLGFTINLLWKLRHLISLEKPKFGELIAFRKLFDKIPPTAVDEECIVMLTQKKGFESKYIPEAVVYNKGPTTIKDFIKQRRRIYAGHLHLKKTSGYAASTMNHLKILKFLIGNINLKSKSLIWALGAIFLESYARFLGYYDFYIKKKKHYIWDIAESTKIN